MSWLELRVPPVAQVGIHAFAMWAVSTMSPSLAVPIPGGAFVAVVLLGVGAVIGLTGVAAFRRANTTVNPTTPGASSVVVSSGVYGWSRNPMYLGLLLILSGWAVWLGHLLAFAFLPLFALYMNRFQIRPEERAMRSTFGAEYEHYLESVRRWI